jgi:hypothetical protein
MYLVYQGSLSSGEFFGVEQAFSVVQSQSGALLLSEAAQTLGYGFLEKLRQAPFTQAVRRVIFCLVLRKSWARFHHNPAVCSSSLTFQQLTMRHMD